METCMNGPDHHAPAPLAREADDHLDDHDDIVYPSSIAFVLAHLACLGALWSGVTAEAVWLAIGLYWLRMFAVTGAYHRYFSHRTFKTSRAFQFVLAVLAQTTAQKSAIWWASKHRHHHKYSDTPADVHSPRHRGFLYAHLGWIFSAKHDEAYLDLIPDLTKYPELMWLHRHELVPAVVLAVLCFVIAGWPGLFVGFFWSTVAVYHGTFFINSLAHVVGNKRYVTGDDSRNNWWLAVITMGEGWHNNHHAFPYSTRQGFFWWEWDPTYYILKGLSKIGLVWDLRAPPAEVLANEHRLSPRVIEKAAADLAATFPLEHWAKTIREAYAATPSMAWPSLAEFQQRLGDMQARASDAMGHMPWPQVPSLEDVRQAAQAMYARTPSLDDIAARTHQMLLQGLAQRLAAVKP
jgi:stearoyl-CoA desaturase (delta-9 desaturase)